MEDIVYKFINEEDPEKAREFMLHLVKEPNNQYSHQNCWVVEKDKMVVAAVNIYEGARLAELRKPVIEYVRVKFNRDLTIEDETQAGEYYLDTLAALPSEQGNGLGTMLLQFVIDEYVDKRGETLGLLVEGTNPNARRLYLRLGFKEVGKKIFIGKNMDHLQIDGRTTRGGH